MTNEYLEELNASKLTAAQQEVLDRCKELAYLDYDLWGQVDFDLQMAWADHCLEERLPLIFFDTDDAQITIDLSWTLSRFSEKLKTLIRAEVSKQGGTVTFHYGYNVGKIDNYPASVGKGLVAALTRLVNDFEYAALRAYCFGDREEWPGYHGCGFE